MKKLEDIISSDIRKAISLVFPEKRLKIAMVSYYYPTARNKSINGVSIYVHSISRELAKMGCDVHVFTSSKKESVVTKDKIGNGSLTVHEISIFSNSAISNEVLQRRMQYLEFENKVLKWITKENNSGSFDIINTNGWLTSGAFLAKQLLGMKWIHTFHAVEANRSEMLSLEEKRYKSISRWIEDTASNADHFISVSEALKSEILNAYNINPNRITVIPNGFDPAVFNPAISCTKKKGSLRDKVVMSVARFSVEKGVVSLVNVASKMMRDKDDISFILVLPRGKQSLKSFEAVEANIRSLRKRYKKRIIIITKAVSQKTLARLYNISDVYVQPSLYESFGMTILEAMACGKPIVASRCGGIPEIVRDGYNGLLFRAGDEYDMEMKIKRLLENSFLRKDMSKKSLEISRKYEWSIVAKSTLDIYKKLS